MTLMFFTTFATLSGHISGTSSKIPDTGGPLTLLTAVWEDQICVIQDNVLHFDYNWNILLKVRGTHLA